MWTELFNTLGETSPFLAPAWVASWIHAFGDLLRPDAHVWRAPDGQLAGIALLSLRSVRVGPFWLRRAYINATGEAAVASEHNDLLAMPEHKSSIVADLITVVQDLQGDELGLVGFRRGTAEDIIAGWPGAEWLEGYWSEDPYVDLEELRLGGSAYVAALSGNARSQIRRSIRLYTETFGEPRLDVASTSQDAAVWFKQLVYLHEERWQREGDRGAFNSPRLLRFHTYLIEKSFDAHSQLKVDLLRLSFGDVTVGFLYNLRCGGYVGFYQSGFEGRNDNRLKPGLVTHALAIDYYLTSGANEYDFLAGEPRAAQYKRSLSTHSRDLLWAQLPYGTLRRRAVYALRRAYRRLRSRRKTRDSLSP